MKPTEELRHLINGVNPDDRVDGAGIILLEVHCDGNAEQVLQRCRQAFELVLHYTQENWPSEDTWYKLLPEWFISVCAPEKTQEEEEKYLAEWRKLSREEQILEEESSWSVMEWVSWFEPTDSSHNQRDWFWWDAFIKSPNSLFVAIEVVDIPFPSGSLYWLLKSSGAVSVTEANDLE